VRGVKKKEGKAENSEAWRRRVKKENVPDHHLLFSSPSPDLKTDTSAVKMDSMTTNDFPHTSKNFLYWQKTTKSQIKRPNPHLAHSHPG